MDSDWAVIVEDSDNNRRQKNPLQERTEFYSLPVHYQCDYDEEKKIRRQLRKKKILDQIFNAVCPPGRHA